MLVSFGHAYILKSVVLSVLCRTWFLGPGEPGVGTVQQRKASVADKYRRHEAAVRSLPHAAARWSQQGNDDCTVSSYLWSSCSRGCVAIIIVLSAAWRLFFTELSQSSFTPPMRCGDRTAPQRCEHSHLTQCVVTQCTASGVNEPSVRRYYSRTSCLSASCVCARSFTRWINAPCNRRCSVVRMICGQWVCRQTSEVAIKGSRVRLPAQRLQTICSHPWALSPCSLIWYRSTGDDAQRLGRLIVDLASRWTCVTAFSGIATYGFEPIKRRWSLLMYGVWRWLARYDRR